MTLEEYEDYADLDIHIEGGGGVILLHATSDAGEAFLKELDSESWQWVGLRKLAVDHRYADYLVAMAREKGLAVQ